MKLPVLAPLLKVALPAVALFFSAFASASETESEPQLPGELERRFAALDVDGSNFIERSEAKIGGRRFRVIDQNGDDALSRQEVFAAYQKRVEKFRKELEKRRSAASEPTS